MNLDEIAESLIKAVDGNATEQNIEGVVEVFNGIRRGVIVQWEQHIAANTNELLALYRMNCPECNSKIEVETTGVGVIVSTTPQ